MAVTTPFVEMSAQSSDTQPLSLIKLVAWMRDFVTGGVVGNDGARSVLRAGAPSESAVAKASAGLLYKAQVFNNSGATVYFQVFDAASLPANGAIPALAPQPVATLTFAAFEFATWGRPFTNGIVLAVSSTPATLTRTGGGIFDAVYR